MLYIGVDAHRNVSQLTVMDATGKILKRARVPSSPVGFRAALDEYQEPMKAVLEASYNIVCRGARGRVTASQG